MNLAHTDDQVMIRDAAAEFLADASDAAAVRKAMGSDAGFDAKVWRGIAEMGWCGAAIPESHGGLGLGPVELVLIQEQMGRHLACAPFFSSVCLAANLLVHAGSAAASKKYLPELAKGLRATAAFDSAGLKAKKARGGWQLSGRSSGVVDGASAEVLFLRAGKAFYAVAAGAKGLKAKSLPTWDASRRSADLELKGVASERVDDPAKGAGIERAEWLSRLYLAAEQLGGAQQCLDLIVRYTSERKQFGRAIASFQAVKHRCAQMMVRIEGLRSLVYGAAACAADTPKLDDLALECAGARALAAETFFHCAGEAIQLHGGVGFTEEFEPQLHFKRAQAGSHRLGTPDEMRERIAQALL